MVVHYRKGNLASCQPLDPQRRQSFLTMVEEMTAKPQTVNRWISPLQQLRRLMVAMNPVFASVIVVSLASVLLLWIWQRSVISVTAGELLRRAEVSDLEHSSEHPVGVLYQQVTVKTGRTAFQHTIYRDLSGRRRAHAVVLNEEQLDIQKKLTAVGVDWDQPLSAKGYKTWHDQQSNLRDEVRRSGNSELTLTTTISSGDVAQESLTVREADFHPIRRVVEMRDDETIEVAELDYAVLGWNAVNPSLFEPSAAGIPLQPLVPSVHAILPHSLPTAMQIDSAELEAITTINQLGAETQDQIRVSHSDAGVVVKGIVATNQRKRELLAHLDQILLVHSQILSTEEMQAHLPGVGSNYPKAATGAPVQMYSAPAQFAPLAKFLEDRNLSAEQLSATSKPVLDASLKVQQAGQQLAQLQERFPSVSTLPQQSQVRYQALKTTYRRAITEGLIEEFNALRPIGLIGSAGIDSASASVGLLGPTALQTAIDENQRLCQELIVASASESRPAATIAADIEASAQRITTSLGSEQEISPQP